jgi:exopolysaccharide biosynthesis WecB/TagA/CpsF family protein
MGVRPVPQIDVLGVRFACLSPEAAISEAELLYDRPESGWIAVENVHAVNIAFSDRAHQEVLNRADLVLNDGKGLLLGARLLGRSFPADLNGNFFTPLLLARAAELNWPVYFLGAGPGIAQRAAEVQRREHPGLQIVGVHDGYFPGRGEEVVEGIRAAGTGLLLVGLGMPIQEQWLDANLERTGARLGVTVGAFYDFQAGVVPRAPAWMNSAGLEWVYRLYREPRRLWRRYLLGNPQFVFRVLEQRLARARRSDAGRVGT